MSSISDENNTNNDASLYSIDGNNKSIIATEQKEWRIPLNNASLWSEEQIEWYFDQQEFDKLEIKKQLLNRDLLSKKKELIHKEQLNNVKMMYDVRHEEIWNDWKLLVKKSIAIEKESAIYKVQATEEIERLTEKVKLLELHIANIQVEDNQIEENFITEIKKPKVKEIKSNSSTRSSQLDSGEQGSNNTHITDKIPRSDIENLKNLLEKDGPVEFMKHLEVIFDLFGIKDVPYKIKWVKARIINGKPYLNSIEPDKISMKQLEEIIKLNDDPIGRKQTYKVALFKAAELITDNGKNVREFINTFEKYYGVVFEGRNNNNIIEEFKGLLKEKMSNKLDKVVPKENVIISDWIIAARNQAEIMDGKRLREENRKKSIQIGLGENVTPGGREDDKLPDKEKKESGVPASVGKTNK